MLTRPLDSRTASALVVEHHYMHRKPPISMAFGCWSEGVVVGVATFGVPASHHMVSGACPEEPGLVLELNRLWMDDHMPRNTETRFLSACFRQMPPRIILSYADTAAGHIGYVYRAGNWFYAGWTDMERKTARFDYLVPGKHSRSAFRSGEGVLAEKVRRRPKVKYWTVTGDRRDRRRLRRLCQWPRLCWKTYPPPLEHQAFPVIRDSI